MPRAKIPKRRRRRTTVCIRLPVHLVRDVDGAKATLDKWASNELRHMPVDPPYPQTRVCWWGMRPLTVLKLEQAVHDLNSLHPGKWTLAKLVRAILQHSKDSR